MKDAWDRFHWLWEILFAVAYLSTTALLLLDRADPARTAVAVTAITALALTYLLWGRRLVRDDDSPGGPRWAFAIVVLLFGTKKIPDFAKGLGEGIRNFKDAMKGDDEGKKQ